MLDYEPADRLHVEIQFALLQVRVQLVLVIVGCQQYSGRSDLSCAISAVTVSTTDL